mmetsp:Transcript_10684/g.20042  ORF Transcript_10684/g.20042 Transcript_10684/m.20042 type:complete len:218 (+) Transcript_10684:3106-3759(+)
MRKNRKRFRDQDAEASWVEPWKLSMMESYYLLVRGEINIVSDDKQLTAAEFWKECSTSEGVSCASDFALLYAAFFSLREQGWVVKMGRSYGGDLVVYQGDPDFFHSQFCVLVKDSKTTPWNWLSVSREMRVSQQTAKEVMLCEVTLLEDAAVPGCKATVDCAVMLRWMLQHEELGKERQVLGKLKKKLIAPVLKIKKQQEKQAKKQKESTTEKSSVK